MKRMKLSELTGNEILAQSLMTWDSSGRRSIKKRVYR